MTVLFDITTDTVNKVLQKNARTQGFIDQLDSRLVKFRGLLSEELSGLADDAIEVAFHRTFPEVIELARFGVDNQCSDCENSPCTCSHDYNYAGHCSNCAEWWSENHSLSECLDEDETPEGHDVTECVFHQNHPAKDCNYVCAAHEEHELVECLNTCSFGHDHDEYHITDKIETLAKSKLIREHTYYWPSCTFLLGEPEVDKPEMNSEQIEAELTEDELANEELNAIPF